MVRARWTPTGCVPCWVWSGDRPDWASDDWAGAGRPAARPGSVPVSALRKPEASAEETYFLLADLTGYTSFLAGVEQIHGVDFSVGVPAGFGVMAALLEAVVEGVQSDFELEQLEGDAVFAVARADALDGRGEELIRRLRAVHTTFRARRDEAAVAARDHVCTACPAVAHVDLKMVVHRGQAVRQAFGDRHQLLGPAVNVAHRLLKNTIPPRIGYRPYVFLTTAAADALGLPDIGIAHREEYPDVGPVAGRIVELDDGTGAPDAATATR